MNKTISFQKNLIIFGIPLLLVGLMILIANSSLFRINPDNLAIGITFDLLLTVPFVYFLLIRKTNIPKTTIVPFLIFGVVICSIILPSENQKYLNLFKTWILPIVELSVLSYVVYNIRKGIKSYKLKKGLSVDFFTTLKNICYEILPSKIAIFFAFEIATFYYGFIYWKKRILKENEFSYHKDSATISTLFAFIFIVGIETFVFHILLMRWSNVAAWIFSFFSIYTAIQLFGFLKSIIKRPISIENNKLNLYYGIMNEAIIDIQQISSIEITSKDIEFNKEMRKFSFLDSPNIIVKLKNENTMNGLYGMRRKFKSLALYVDNTAEFKKQIENALQQRI